jgi:hypothetical protein
LDTIFSSQEFWPLPDNGGGRTNSSHLRLADGGGASTAMKNQIRRFDMPIKGFAAFKKPPVDSSVLNKSIVTSTAMLSATRIRDVVS